MKYLKFDLFKTLLLICCFSLCSCNKIDGIEEETPDIEDNSYQMKITVNEKVFIANMLDNITSNKIKSLLPFEIPMENLFQREMCYRFEDPLPYDDAKVTGYEIGEIIYYPPMHSFVIMYEQNGEHFNMQKIGKIDEDVSYLENVDNIIFKFEIMQ